MMKLFKLLMITICFFAVKNLQAKRLDADALYEKLQTRLSAVSDYVADVQVKIDVSFMKVPPLDGKLYFKAPNKMKFERGKGISILPKKNVNLTLNSMLPVGEATVIDAGTSNIDGKEVRIIKVVPNADAGDIILTKIWVDETRNLALRTESTTRDNGTVKMDLSFGKYIDRGLPDKVTVHLDVKEYKLPKGVTMDYETSTTETHKKTNANKSKKGTIEIFYLNYKVNQGLSDGLFDEKQ